MKLSICHFTQPIVICGAHAPKTLNMKATNDRAYVVGMELDFDKRGVWLDTNGQRTPVDMRGRLFIPMERVVLAVPATEPVVEKKTKAA